MRSFYKLIYMFFFHPILLIYTNGNLLVRRKIDIRYSDIKYTDFGKNVRLGYSCRINVYNEFKNEKKLVIGNDVYIGNRVSFLIGGNIIIDNDVLIASDVTVTSENHGINPIDKKPYSKQGLIYGNVKIGEGVWIGEKVIILPNVKIGKKSIIGAGSIVTKDIPDYSIAVGNPAKVIKKYDFKKEDWIVVS